MARSQIKENEYCFKVNYSRKNLWYLNSGCLRHMTSDKSHFINLKPKMEEKLRLVTTLQNKLKE
ncbi:hypothetical protein J1N35_001334 [Gossypium stocksii]|uniref:Retrovirus-related Pol polyprotein from transposon TNT 1-94-like beta-barrel domain-containing protein n=1 Tax=Gossypium stocksii TaxID=47602 RepID=A0A9D3WJ56_9ROSI|nr:hypothetical protein J1N35_001334 [Gossypium stocksii]